MKIFFATSEMVPYAKTGGLADVCGSLPGELTDLGHEVCVVMPKYKKIDAAKFGLKKIIEGIEVPLGGEKKIAKIFSARYQDKVTVYFVDNGEYFGRDELYGTPMGDYPDNDCRFIFFQRAALELMKAVDFKPDVIHCHDWQSGLIPVYLKTVYKDDPFFRKTKSFFTIHNLAYQGNFPPDTLPTAGLGWEEFQMDRLEFYGKMSFLKGGLIYSDAVTTVSERYAEEIQTKEYGAGLEGVLTKRKSDLYGIVNGIDLEEWNPEKDPDLAVRYSVQDAEKKQENKKALQKENRLEVNAEIPVFGIITRLADQKGLDILAPVLEDFARKLNAHFVLLGTGEEKYHKILREEMAKYPKKFAFHIMFDAKMAKRIYAGSDIFLMPSCYEPCGLGQLISMRYGTIPLVRETGGLADTVSDFNPKTGKGNGFVFREYTSEKLFKTMERAVELFRKPKVWRQIVENAMQCDFSWNASAKKYVALYKQVKKVPLA
ncbi:MAG TPA: glycogen synthase GlgA [Candidatus Omnitrophota bacterium]|nr:glycogen synthase GlgA [Candidatus Omnitrophota bacterium]